jgi:TPP-dependent pyruvate/acetoin dehydrogenase alpha subunit
MSNFGEEATQVGACQSLCLKDLIYCQYRELGVFIHREVPLQELAD